MRSPLLLAAALGLCAAGPALAQEAAAKPVKNKTAVTVGGVAGSVAGSSVAGPIGGFVGGAVGKAVAGVVAPSKPAAEPILVHAPPPTPEQRVQAANDAPPAWADPGQAQRERRSAPPPADPQ